MYGAENYPVYGWWCKKQDHRAAASKPTHKDQCVPWYLLPFNPISNVCIMHVNVYTLASDVIMHYNILMTMYMCTMYPPCWLNYCTHSSLVKLHYTMLQRLVILLVWNISFPLLVLMLTLRMRWVGALNINMCTVVGINCSWPCTTCTCGQCTHHYCTHSSLVKLHYIGLHIKVILHVWNISFPLLVLMWMLHFRQFIFNYTLRCH